MDFDGIGRKSGIFDLSDSMLQSEILLKNRHHIVVMGIFININSHTMRSVDVLYTFHCFTSYLVGRMLLFEEIHLTSEILYFFDQTSTYHLKKTTS